MILVAVIFLLLCECSHGTQLDATTTGIFKSDNHPGQYPNNYDEEWTITASQGKAVRVGFSTAIDLGSGDYLLLTDVSSGSQLSKFVGTINPPIVVTSYGNQMKVEIHSDGGDKGTGFVATYAETEPDDTSTEIKVVGPLEFISNKKSGMIESPNYPQLYPHDYDYNWVIAVDEDELVQFTFTEYMSLEKCCDYVEILDYLYNVSISVKKYSTTGTPNGVTSRAHVVRVYFHTDGFLRYGGFRMEWAAIVNPNSVTTAAPGLGSETIIGISVGATVGGIILLIGITCIAGCLYRQHQRNLRGKVAPAASKYETKPPTPRPRARVSPRQRVKSAAATRPVTPRLHKTERLPTERGTVHIENEQQTRTKQKDSIQLEQRNNSRPKSAINDENSLASRVGDYKEVRHQPVERLTPTTSDRERSPSLNIMTDDSGDSDLESQPDMEARPVTPPPLRPQSGRPGTARMDRRTLPRDTSKPLLNTPTDADGLISPRGGLTRRKKLEPLNQPSKASKLPPLNGTLPPLTPQGFSTPMQKMDPLLPSDIFAPRITVTQPRQATS